MAVFRPRFTDPKTGERRTGSVGGTNSTLLAGPSLNRRKLNPRPSRSKPSRGGGGSLRRDSTASSTGDERIRTLKELADAYLEDYRLRSKAVLFAEYALGHLTRLVGDQMAVEVSERTVKEFRTAA
jgi:hypothetical protein